MGYFPHFMQRVRKRQAPEGVLQLQILKVLRARGFYCAKLKTKGSYANGHFILDRYQAVGCPDLICFSPSLSFIEVKAGKNIQTLEQEKFEQYCKNANIPYILARNIEDVLFAIK
jgi:hypothetical protein